MVAFNVNAYRDMNEDEILLDQETDSEVTMLRACLQATRVAHVAGV
jgi:hypothetical protein